MLEQAKRSRGIGSLMRSQNGKLCEQLVIQYSEGPQMQKGH